MSSEEEDRIRKDHEKGMGYRQLAKKHRKSFTQLSKIIKNPISLSERIEALEEAVELLKEDAEFEEPIIAWITDREDFCPVCYCSDTRMEPTEHGYKCPACGKTWPLAEGDTYLAGMRAPESTSESRHNTFD